MLSEKAVKEYIEIYQREFDVAIDAATAHIQGEKLLRLMDLLLSPVTTVSGVRTNY